MVSSIEGKVCAVCHELSLTSNECLSGDAPHWGDYDDITCIEEALNIGIIWLWDDAWEAQGRLFYVRSKEVLCDKYPRCMIISFCNGNHFRAGG